ncbi:MAG: DUF1592 domain-containing protein [Polyangiales bacterium]
MTTLVPARAAHGQEPTCPTLRALEPEPVQALTLREIRATVTDLLAVPDGGWADITLPPDPRIDGLDGQGAISGVSAQQLERLFEVNERLVSRLEADGPRAARVFGCAPTAPAGDPCVRAFVRGFGRRAFRRPLSAEEEERFVRLAAGGTSARHGLGAVVEAMLLSPQFLLQSERGVAVPTCPGVRRLTGFELAARLALLLTGRGPDEALLDLAAAGALDTQDGVEAAARALISQRASREGVREFFRQWLRIDTLTHRDASDYVDEWESVRDAAVEEAERLVDTHAWGPSANLLDALTAASVEVNPALARFYGLDPVGDAGWRLHTWGAASERAGLLTTAAVLMATAPHNPTAFGTVVRRGLYVRGTLMCEPFGPPPPDAVVNPSSPRVGATLEARVTEHAADPRCASCHARIDPVGMGFARFDDVGRLAPETREGERFSGAGRLAGASPPEFSGVVELARRLRTLPEVSACAATQWYRWTFGRTEQVGDLAYLDVLRARFAQSGNSVPALIAATVRSDVFRFRRIAEEAP